MNIIVLVTMAVLGQQAPAPSPYISAYYSMDAGTCSSKPAPNNCPYRWLHIDGFPFIIDPNGDPHIAPFGIKILNEDGTVVGTRAAIKPVMGFGMTMDTVDTGDHINLQYGVDTTQIYFRADPPTGPGPCNSVITGLPQGSLALAFDRNGYPYTCAKGPDIPQGTAWSSGTAVVAATAALLSPQLSISGMTPNGTVLATDQITVDNQTTFPTIDATADATGNVTIVISPILATGATKGDIVVSFPNQKGNFIWIRGPQPWAATWTPVP